MEPKVLNLTRRLNVVRAVKEKDDDDGEEVKDHEQSGLGREAKRVEFLEECKGNVDSKGEK